MSRYKAYPECKDSGIEWVGMIPRSWEVSTLFSLASTDVVKNNDGAENNVLSLSYGRIIRREVEDNHGLLPESFNTYQLVESGDVILRLTDLQNDKRSLRVGIANEKGIITSAYLKLTAKKKFLDRYLYRLLHSYDTTKVFYGMGGGLRQSMKFEEMRRLQMLCPPLQEQEQIAAFLDHETAKIDALIEKQQRLIELLKEKRQAVISHVVTKGLNPNAPMKDSGVEWLGEVPAHWSIKKLKYLCDIQTGDKNTEDAVDDGLYPFFVRSQTVERLNSYTADCEAVLTAGDGAGVGKVFHYFEGKFDFHQRVYMMNRFRAVSGNFFFNYLSIMFHMVALDGGAKSTVDSLRMPLFMNFQLTVPTSEEQEDIVKFIEAKNHHFNELTKRATDGIELLQERRTALISAAVTGKIDVRDWQPAAT